MGPSDSWLYVLPEKQKAISQARGHARIKLATFARSQENVSEFVFNVVLSLFISIDFQVELVTPGRITSQICRRRWSISRVRYVINCDVAPFGKLQYQI